MNNIRKYTFLIFALISVYAGAQLNLNINIAYPAPGYLSDWAYGKSGMATLVLNQENQLLKIKFQTQLQTLDGSIIATSNCTDTANGGGWQLEGGETPAGETSPLLYAGGLVQLGETALS